MDDAYILQNVQTFGQGRYQRKNGSYRNCYLIKCSTCEKIHPKEKSDLIKGIKANKKFFCSLACKGLDDTKNARGFEMEVTCKQCATLFVKNSLQVDKTNGNNFCTKSCAATHNNKNKKYGTRRSRQEIYIEKQIKSNYSNLNCICNGKETIGSELDFYFSDLKLAIQINGITHYEPIYGQIKFANIQKLDQEKKEKCKELGIKLYEINCCNDSYINQKLLHKRWLEFEEILKNNMQPEV